MLNRFFRNMGMVATLLIFVLILQSVDAIKMPKINLGKTADKVLKGAGIVLLVKQFGGELNNFINTLLANRGVPNRDATRVVPILTFGQGVEAGACQVSGPEDAVARVQAVLAVAATFDKGKWFNVQALVPTTSLNPTRLDRVYGVGVSAIIDYKL